jgi:predicted Zn-dependent protease with MMP-like domain
MNRLDFEKIITEEYPKAVPEKFRAKLANVAFLVEEKPSRDVRKEEGLASNETLLGLYRGIPQSARGSAYGVGPTIPDVIILYRLPIHEEAQAMVEANLAKNLDGAIRMVVHDTIWHEVAHYLGLGEEEVRAREKERKSPYLPIPAAVAAQQSLEPIEVEKEDPSMQKMLHTTLVPRSENASSIDSEGGGPGIKNWWETKQEEKPRGILPEDMPPLGSPEIARNEKTQSKKGEPPSNLPG